MSKALMKNLQHHGCSNRAGVQPYQFLSHLDNGQREPILVGLRSRRFNLAERSSIGSPLMYTVKMRVLILNGTLVRSKELGTKVAQEP